jgi:hypothetical protein
MLAEESFSLAVYIRAEDFLVSRRGAEFGGFGFLSVSAPLRESWFD